MLTAAAETIIRLDYRYFLYGIPLAVAGLYFLHAMRALWKGYRSDVADRNDDRS